MASETANERAASICAFRVGDAFERACIVGEADIRRFAELSGDENPLHHDAGHASASSFGGLIASAAHCFAILSGCVGSFVSRRAPGVGLAFSFELLKAVRCGQTVALRWEISDVQPAAKRRFALVSMTGTLRLEDGTLAVTATSRCSVKRSDEAAT